MALVNPELDQTFKTISLYHRILAIGDNEILSLRISFAIVVLFSIALWVAIFYLVHFAMYFIVA